MKKKMILSLLTVCFALTMNAQTALKKVYDEDINPLEQIDQALVKAKSEGKYVICQVGGNWCPWCLKFADFITKDTAISKVIADNFEFIHVNYNPRKSQGEEKMAQGKALMQRLDNAGRFGYPVFVVLDMEGRILHIQDSGYLEEGEGYNQEKVLRFFKNWTPQVVKGIQPQATGAPTQYFLSTAGASDGENDRPMIEVYLPQQPNGCGVVLCPGGAMRWLSWESDVVKMASFLNEHGIAAIGLRYHLNKGGGQMPQGTKMPPMVDVTHPEVFPQADANPMHNASGDSIIRLAAQDAKAAIRMVREHADEWHISKDKIGFLGFSAGGGVAIAATMSADKMERPDFLCTNFGPSLMPVTVPKDAPPLLIMTRVDHPNVAAGLVALFMEWKKAGADAELHMYGDGKGPYELMPQTGETTTETWSSQMIHWLKTKGFMHKD